LKYLVSLFVVFSFHIENIGFKKEWDSHSLFINLLKLFHFKFEVLIIIG